MKAIIRVSDLQILAILDDESSGSFALETMTMSIQIPEDMDSDCLEASLNEDEEIVLSESSSKIQAKRNKKLDLLRSLRSMKLPKVDQMIRELTLQLRSDRAAIVAYRQSLLDVTEDYKKVNGDAKAAIDDLDLEDESIWPEELGD